MTLIELPAMSGIEYNHGERIIFCSYCKEKIDTCKCLCAVIRELYKKVDDLEERMNTLLLDNMNFKVLIENFNENSRPYKCPICKGSSFDKKGMMCNTCEGNGIVWR